MGWKLNSEVSLNDSLNLKAVADSRTPTLGAVMDEGVRQYQRLLPLTAKDMRLLNWHFANLEYANAANVGNLSLSGWDQDMGNEFEGEHSQIVGGYEQVTYGLWSFPAKLDVRPNRVVSKISYDPMGKEQTVVQCEDGELFPADKVVFTGSLGVLKHKDVEFEPPLPDWKTGPIDRLGFGVMNKVVLVFGEPFWDTERDMFGLLREPSNDSMSMAQEDYSANRGKCYLFWNCLKTTGLPVLLGLMAGDAAQQTEHTADSEIIADALSHLRSVFKNVAVPDPLETVISRWASDKFTRGSYSFVGAEALPEDYDLMAEPVGNLHFAGEATCGTHPATVHGAYLSGMRAAAEVTDSIVGPVEIPQPLVPEKNKIWPSAATMSPSTSSSVKRTPNGSVRRRPKKAPPYIPSGKGETEAKGPTPKEAYDKEMWEAVHAEIGPPEPRPPKPSININGYLLFQKYNWAKFRDQWMEARRAENKSSGHDELRQSLGQEWRMASADVKRPYLEEAESNQRANAEKMRRWKDNIAEWEKEALEIRMRWCACNPFEEWARTNVTNADGKGIRPSS